MMTTIHCPNNLGDVQCIRTTLRWFTGSKLYTFHADCKCSRLFPKWQSAFCKRVKIVPGLLRETAEVNEVCTLVHAKLIETARDGELHWNVERAEHIRSCASPASTCR